MVGPDERAPTSKYKRWKRLFFVLLFVAAPVALFQPHSPGSADLQAFERVLNKNSNEPCLFHQECVSNSCVQGRCETLWDLNIWAQRRDLIQRLTQGASSNERQQGSNAILTTTLSEQESSILGIRPKLLEAMALHSAPKPINDQLEKFENSNDPEVRLAALRFKGLTQNSFAKQGPQTEHNDLRLLRVDASPGNLIQVCEETNLRRAFPSLDARCARMKCKMNQFIPEESDSPSLKQFWSCVRP